MVGAALRAGHLLAALGLARHDRAVRSAHLVGCLIALSSASCLGNGGVAGGLGRALTVRAVGPLEAGPSVRRSIEPIAVERAEASVDPACAMLVRADAPSAEDALLHELSSAVVLSGGKSVGATSLVLKLPLDGGSFAAFKPHTRKHAGRWRAEVAAYRLARALDLVGVPPSVPRDVKVDTLLASIASAATRHKLHVQAIVRGEAEVEGAMIAWLPHLRPLALERDALWAAWGEWLGQRVPDAPIEARLARSHARVVEAARPLAAQISSMIVLDQLTGNRDRWSGDNVMVDETGTRLVFLDNNLAFDAKIDAARTRKRAQVLARAERFSRTLIVAVRALGREALTGLIGQDAHGAPLLTDAQLDAVLTRRTELLAHVDRLIARYGEERVLAFD
ncbi:MAG: hypothetical protein NVSMB47_00690 [Polyangiales bacterium]